MPPTPVLLVNLDIIAQMQGQCLAPELFAQQDFIVLKDLVLLHHVLVGRRAVPLECNRLPHVYPVAVVLTVRQARLIAYRAPLITIGISLFFCLKLIFYLIFSFMIFHSPQGTATYSSYDCPSGTFSDVGGLYSSSQCSNCTLGNYCPAGSSPISCGAGRYNPYYGGTSSSR